MTLLDRLQAANKARTQGEWAVEYRHVELQDQPTLEKMLELGEFLGACVSGPEEPGRGDFVSWDAYFITLAANSMDKLLEVVRAANQFREAANCTCLTYKQCDSCGDNQDRLDEALEACNGKAD